MLMAAFAVFGLFNVNAQSSFGLMAGYTNISAKISDQGSSISGDESGFYVGGVADFGISEKFHVQPEVLYANANDATFLYIPVLAKFMVSDKFGILAGPQANLSLEEKTKGINSLGIDLTFGANYKITQNFFLEARYGFEVTNRITNSGEYEGSGVKGKVNTLQVGLGYLF